MRLIQSQPQVNRPLGALSGLIKTALAAALFWIGLNSFMIGQAFSLEKGSFLPRLVGAIMVMIGVLLLIRGVPQALRSFFPGARPWSDDY